MSKSNQPTPSPTPAPEPAPTPGPEPTPAPAPIPTPEPAPAPAKEKTYTEAQYQANLAKAQKDWEKKVSDAEAKAKLSEDERLKAERDDALSQLRERDTRDSVTEKAGAAGVKNPRLFYNAYKSDLEFDDKGIVTNLKDILETAKAESPELFAPPPSAPAPSGSADGGAGNNNQVSGLYSREELNKLTATEINADWDKVQKSLMALN
jgi:hypothetical protein